MYSADDSNQSTLDYYLENEDTFEIPFAEAFIFKKNFKLIKPFINYY